MAEIYNNTVENTLILAPREYVSRPFSFGASWTEIRMGMFFGLVSAVGDNVNSVAETVAIASAADRITFGIKDSSAVVPGAVGSQFLGAITNYASGAYGYPPTSQNVVGAGLNWVGTNYAASGNNTLCAVGANGTTLATAASQAAPGTPVTSGYSTTMDNMWYPTTISGVSSYCGFFGLRFVIANAGLATQTVTIWYSSNGQQAVAGSNYSVPALQTLLNNTAWGGTGNTWIIQWNNGSVAYSIPSYWWLRLPLYNNRIRISAMEIMKIS
jgi:hypothetical protein